MNSNINIDQLSLSNDRHLATSTRRNSSRISTREISNSRHQSGVREGISKLNISSRSRRSSKGTPQSRRKKNGNIIDAPTEMEYDDNDNLHNLSSSENPNESEQNLLNISSASTDTIIVENPNNNKKLEKRPIEYFTPINDSEKVKCSICLRVRKFSSYTLLEIDNLNILYSLTKPN